MSRCNLCGGTVLRVVETAADGVSTLRCSRCGLIFLDPFPPFDPAAHYDAAYYRPWLAEQGRERGRLWARRVALLGRFARVGRLLDVGCGDGAFLLAAREAGWRVVGTEVSRWSAERLRSECGLAVHQGDLLHLDGIEPGFDAITLWHVLEHLERPLQTLCRARSLLAPGGTLVVAVPNSAFTLFRLVYPLVRFRRLRYYTPGERELHLHHFTRATLRAILEAAGFRLVHQGIDRSALRLPNLLLEQSSRAVLAATGACWSEALLAVSTPARP